jgi:hypothetical protein
MFPRAKHEKKAITARATQTKAQIAASGDELSSAKKASKTSGKRASAELGLDLLQVLQDQELDTMYKCQPQAPLTS